MRDHGFHIELCFLVSSLGIERICLSLFSKSEKRPELQKSCAEAKKVSEWNSRLPIFRVRPAGIPALDAARIFNLEISVLTGASLEQDRRDLPSEAGRDYPRWG